MSTNTLALNDHHDIYLDSSGQLAIVRDNESIAQNISTALQLWLGEAEFDVALGVPYLQILGQKLTPDEVKAYITPVVLNVAGVASINSIEVSFDADRKVNIFTEVVTDSGEIINAAA